MPDPVGAADEWDLAGGGVVRAGSHLLVDRFQRCSVNMHDDFVVSRDRLWELVTSRGFAQLVQNGGTHKGSYAALSLRLSGELDGAIRLGPFPRIPHDKCSQDGFHESEELVEVPGSREREESHQNGEDESENNVQDSAGASGESNGQEYHQAGDRH